VPAVFVICLNETKAIFGGPKATQATEDVRWPTALTVSLRCVANSLECATCEAEGSVKPVDVFGISTEFGKKQKVGLYQRDMIGQSTKMCLIDSVCIGMNLNLSKTERCKISEHF
jgi:hypothetical protein